MNNNIVTKSFSAAQQHNIIDLIEHYNGFAYISGSIIEGFGNTTSDTDLFIIIDGLDKNILLKKLRDPIYLVTEKDSFVYNFKYNDMRYDCEFISQKDFSDCIYKINNYNILSEEFEDQLNTQDADFLHRFKYGIPLINEINFYNFYNNMSFENLDYHLAFYHAKIHGAILEDLNGAFTSRDYGTAFFRTRVLVDNILSGYLATFGETNPSSKWLYRKLVRYTENNNNIEIYDKYMKLQSVKFDESEVENFISESIIFCQKLNTHIQTFLNNFQR